ncbi:hypothetical protein D0Z67_01195 [Streptomyces seoulensis]|uniref:Uncharacterized protein n=1 Tax=Streptomyces seoulensis TaxID=73044 RepID=A0A4P6TR50_STRSO|nr:DUF6510 family protein [Streptomyces seoulensis]QBJ89072.1 hypothetical protein D0Z67_01195 [Streptomyces seoulensis]
MLPREEEPTSPKRHRLDGNALAGPLSELFAVDLTVATRRCAHCGAEGSPARSACGPAGAESAGSRSFPLPRLVVLR